MPFSLPCASRSNQLTGARHPKISLALLICIVDLAHDCPELLVFKIKDCVLARVDSLLLEEDVKDEARWEWRQSSMRKRMRMRKRGGIEDNTSVVKFACAPLAATVFLKLFLSENIF